MPLAPADRSSELQRSVVAMRVIFDANPAHLHDAIVIAADTEVHSIGRTVLRKMRAVAGVAEIAALPEFLVGRCYALVSRGGAVPGETIAEREASAMRPQFGIVSNRRKEIRTSQEPSQSGN